MHIVRGIDCIIKLKEVNSAGILLYRYQGGILEVYLVHPGGPFFRNKDDGAWTIPKGEVEAGESLEQAARREFSEETGGSLEPDLLPLGNIRQKGGKVVHAWAAKGIVPSGPPISNSFEIEWPPRSGKRVRFPEIDQGRFFDTDAALIKINPAQREFIDRLLREVPHRQD